MIPRSYIQYRPTTGYHKATEELKDGYDKLVIYLQVVVQYDCQTKMEYRPPNFRQMIATSYYFAKECYDKMKHQELRHLAEETTRRTHTKALHQSIREGTTTMDKYDTTIIV
eukprot:6485817-Amphidinium_carterae.1